MQKLMTEARMHYQYMGSINAEKDEETCEAIAQIFTKLANFLKPSAEIQIGESSQTIHVNAVMAANCQFILKDLRAHELALRFLRRPFRRVQGALVLCIFASITNTLLNI